MLKNKYFFFNCAVVLVKIFLQHLFEQAVCQSAIFYPCLLKTWHNFTSDKMETILFPYFFPPLVAFLRRFHLTPKDSSFPRLVHIETTKGSSKVWHHTVLSLISVWDSLSAMCPRLGSGCQTESPGQPPPFCDRIVTAPVLRSACVLPYASGFSKSTTTMGLFVQTCKKNTSPIFSVKT